MNATGGDNRKPPHSPPKNKITGLHETRGSSSSSRPSNVLVTGGFPRFGRGSGCCTIVYGGDGRPEELCFWGTTDD